MSHEDQPPARGDKPSPQFQSVLATVLRLDIYDSTAAVQQGEREFLAVIQELKGQVHQDIYPSLIGNGPADEGDAVRAAFADVREALLCAFRLRHLAQKPVELKDRPNICMQARVILHFGEFQKTEDGLTKGNEQILVTRLDHAVAPDEIWATEAVYDITRHIHADSRYSFEYMGQCEFDKGKGTHPCYRVNFASAGGSGGGALRPYSAVEAATQMLARGDALSQASAVAVLTNDESQLTSDKLMEIALDSNIDIRARNAALAVLRKRGDYINIRRITEAFTREDSPTELRAQFLLVLGATRNESVINTLVTAAINIPGKPSRIRETALLAMYGFRESLIGQSVIGALTDPEVEVRKAACVAAGGCRYMSGEVCRQLCDIALKPEFPIDLRSVACEALCSQKITDVLIEMWANIAQNNRLPLTLRSYAIGGLAQSDDPAALRAVDEVARRVNDDLQGEAGEVLPAMRAPRRRVRHRVKRPESDIAEVIRLRTRPPRDESDEDAM